jgi:DNA processing protein
VSGEAERPPPEAYVVALACLDGIGPARLRALLSGRSPQEAWEAVVAGRAPAGRPVGEEPAAGVGDEAARWAVQARDLDPAALWERHRRAGVGVSVWGGEGYPVDLLDDPEPPPVLFHRGDLAALDGPRVAVVGTRDCTRTGRDIAFELGRDLAEAGVRVVSGLALGIDGAAHAGALAAAGAPPVAVVGSGLDVVYPRRNGRLWAELAERGLLLSEYPLATPPTAWHFPARNRILAALADLVVVVESHDRGGALLTVDAAEARQRPVMAVPGSVRSPASAGTNRLLAELEHGSLCRDATDVLVRLGLEGRALGREAAPQALPPPEDLEILDALGWQPASLEQIVAVAARPIGEVALALDRLEAGGWVARRGGWFERVGGTDR